MAPDANCPTCPPSSELSEEEVAEILARYLRDYGGELAAETTCQARLALCRACEALKFGTTCAFCGCLVQVRTKLLARNCPHPAGRLW